MAMVCCEMEYSVAVGGSDRCDVECGGEGGGRANFVREKHEVSDFVRTPHKRLVDVKSF